MRRPAIVLAVGLILGLLASAGGALGVGSAALACAALLAAALVGRARARRGLRSSPWPVRQGIWAALLGLALGLGRGALDERPLAPDDVARRATADGTRWLVTGRLAESPRTKSVVSPPLVWTRFALEVDGIADPGDGAAEGGPRAHAATLGGASADAPGWARASGRIDVFLRPLERALPALAVGDRVLVEGDLTLPPSAGNPGQLDVRALRASEGVHASLSVRRWDRVEVLAPGSALLPARLLAAARARLGAMLDHGLGTGSTAAALARALVLGDREALGDDVRDRFERAGTVHVLAVSGLHTAVLAAGLLGLLRLVRVPRRAAAAAGIAATWVYCGLVGGQPSVLRATIMVTAYLMAPLLRRDPDGLSALGLAAVAVLLAEPAQLASPGFQLSFVAVLGLIAVAAPLSRALRRRFARRHEGAWAGLRRRGALALADAALASAIASAATAPLVLYHFHVVTPLAVVTNVVCAPLFLVALGGAAAYLAIAAALPVAWLSAAAPVAWLARQALDLLDGAVAAAAGLGLAGYAPSVSAGQVLVACGLLAGSAAAIVARPRSRGRAEGAGWPGPRALHGEPAAAPPRGGATVVRGVLAALGCLLAGLALVPPGPLPLGEGEARVTILDVSHGSAALVETGGGVAVFDCGSSRLQPGRRVIGPALWDAGHRRIDRVVLSHPDADHTNGLLDLLDRFEVGALHVGPAFREDPRGASLLAEAERRGAAVVVLREGDRVALGAGVVAEVLAAPPLAAFGGRDPRRSGNDASLVVRVRAREGSVLFTGDIEERGVRRLLAGRREGGALEAEVVVIPHHGAANRVAEALAEAAGARLALSSSRRGFGSRRTLSAFARGGAHLAETWQGGAVLLELGSGRVRWESYAAGRFAGVGP